MHLRHGLFTDLLEARPQTKLRLRDFRWIPQPKCFNPLPSRCNRQVGGYYDMARGRGRQRDDVDGETVRLPSLSLFLSSRKLPASIFASFRELCAACAKAQAERLARRRERERERRVFSSIYVSWKNVSFSSVSWITVLTTLFYDYAFPFLSCFCQ